MKRLLLAPLAVAITPAAAPTAAADPAFQTECTRFPGAFPGATGGQIIINSGGIFANCQYPGPADGGGAEMLPGTGCVIAPAGNFACRR